MDLDEAKRLLTRAFGRELQRHWGRIGKTEIALGYARGHFGRLLRQEKSGISLDLIIQAMVLLDVEPGEFFAKAYDIGLTSEHLLGSHEGQGDVDPALKRFRKATLQLESGSLAVPRKKKKPRDFTKRLESLSREDLCDQRKSLRRTKMFRQPAFVAAYLERLDSLRYSRAKNVVKLAQTVAVDLLPKTPGSKEEILELMCKTVGIFGSANRQILQLEVAAEAIGFGLRLAGRQGLELARADLLQRGAYVLRDNGEFNRALLLLGEAQIIYSDHEHEVGVAKTLVDRATMLGYKEDHPRALRLFMDALDRLPSEDGGLQRWRLAALDGITISYRKLGNLQAAEKWLKRALSLMNETEGSIYAKLLWEVGAMAHEKGEFLKAEGLFGKAREILAVTENPIPCASITIDLMATLLEQGKVTEICQVAAEMTALLTPFRYNKIAAAAITQVIRTGMSGKVTRRLLKEARDEISKAHPEDWVRPHTS
ncbi:MAG: tetratricopeptide repeat protein [bacterium]|nr:tetratricopeptide repeat protein [bacterium]